MATYDPIKKPSFFLPRVQAGDFFVLLGALLLVLLVPDSAYAANEMANIICNLTDYLTGTTGKAMSTVAVTIVGVMALYGRASWGTAFTVAVAIGLVYGATGVVQQLGQSYTCTNKPPTFQCVGATPVGSLFDADTMANAQGAGNAQAPSAGNAQSCVESNTGQTGNCGIFARVLWMFKNTIGQIMSAMYCGFSNALRVPLSAALTLFVVVYGIMIITGIAKFDLKSSAIVLFKFALIWAFAMDADWGIGVGYNFFINFAEAGSNIVLGALPHSKTGTVPSLSSPDAVFASILTSTTGTQSTVSSTPLACTVFLEIIFLFLIFFMPIILGFLLLIIISYIGNFARAMLNYLTSLVLISFLFIMAPFFLGFALFRTTMPLFEAWIKHLISFSLQMVIMFGFMALLAMIPFADFFNELLALLKGYSITLNFGPVPFVFTHSISMCGICQYHITPASVDAAGNYTQSAIACVPHPLNLAGMTQTQQNQALLNFHQAAVNQVDDSGQKGYMPSDDHQYYVMSLLNLLEHSDFAKFVIVQGISLYLISKIVGDFMKKAPQLAAAIGKLPIAAALGGGATPGGVKIGYIGLESIEAGFIGLKNGFKSFMVNPLRNPLAFGAGLMQPRKAFGNLKEGLKLALIGKKGEDGKFEAGMGFLGGMISGAAEMGPDNMGKQKRIEAANARRGQYKKERKAAQEQIEDYKKRMEQAGSKQEAQALFEKAREIQERLLPKIDRKIEHEDKLMSRLGMEMFGASKKGLVRTMGREGVSSLDVTRMAYSSGDETGQHRDKMKARHVQRNMYGRVLDGHESGYYYFMKIPQGVNPAETPMHNMSALRSAAESKVSNLRLLLLNPSLDPEKRRQLTAKLDAAENSLPSAAAKSGPDEGEGFINQFTSSERAINDVLSTLDSIAGEL